MECTDLEMRLRRSFFRSINHGVAKVSTGPYVAGALDSKSATRNRYIASGKLSSRCHDSRSHPLAHEAVTLWQLFGVAEAAMRCKFGGWRDREHRFLVGIVRWMRITVGTSRRIVDVCDAQCCAWELSTKSRRMLE